MSERRGKCRERRGTGDWSGWRAGRAAQQRSARDGGFLAPARSPRRTAGTRGGTRWSCLTAVGLALAAPAQAGDVKTNVDPDGATQTTVTVKGKTRDVRTRTQKGNRAFNAFDHFKVGADTTVNLHLPYNAEHLINLVKDSAVEVQGVVNSLKDGQIGGHVVFADPHGMVVGAQGQLNVGALTVTTPTEAFAEGLIGPDGAIDAAAVSQLMAGNAPQSEAVVRIDGEVKTQGGVRLQGGRVTQTGAVAVDSPDGRSARVFEAVVNTEGLTSGTGFAADDGSVAIVADGKAEIDGDVVAEGAYGSDAGGVTVTADRVEVGSGARLNTSAAGEGADAGNIRLTGSEVVRLAEGARFDARSEGGAGGDVVLQSDDATRLAGVRARLGGQTDDGALIVDNDDGVITDDVFTGGGKYEHVSGSSITFKPGDDGQTVISTRQVDDPDDVQAHLKGASTGDSGRITLSAPSIEVKDGVQLLSFATDGNKGGDITIEARQDVGNAIEGLPGFIKTVSDVTIGGVLKGANVALKAHARASGAFDPAAAVPVETGDLSVIEQNTGLDLSKGEKLLEEQAPSFRTGYLGAHADALVTVKSTAEVKATAAEGDIDIAASATRKASTDEGLIRDIKRTDLVAGTLLGTTKAKVAPGAVVQAADSVDVSASSVHDLDLTASTNPRTGVQLPATVAFGWVDTQTDAVVAGAEKESAPNTDLAANSLDVLALTETNAAADAAASRESKNAVAGFSAAIVRMDVRTRAEVDTDFQAGANGNVRVIAESSAPSLQAGAVNAQGRPAQFDRDKFGKAAASAIDQQGTSGSPVGFLKDAFGTAQKLRNTKSASGPPLRLGAAVSLILSQQEAEAEIGSGATIQTTGDVQVQARTDTRDVRNHADSQATASPKGTTGGGTAVSAAAAIGFFDNDARAIVDRGATVTAARVGVSAQARQPYNPDSEFQFNTWNGFQTLHTNYLEAQQGVDNVQDAFLTSYARSGTRANTVGLSGAVSVFQPDNRATAWVADDASITASDAVAKNGFTGDMPALGDGLSEARGVIDLTKERQVTWADSIGVQATVETGGVHVTGNFKTLTGFGQSGSGTASFGGAFGWAGHTSEAVAGIGGDASVTGPSVKVDTDSTDEAYTVTPNASRGSSIAVTGMTALTTVDALSSATIDDSVDVTTGSLDVEASQTLTGWTVAGAVTLGKAAGVGVGLALNDVTTETEARIGNNAQRRPTAVAKPESTAGVGLIQAEDGALDLKVDAETEGQLGALAVAGAAATGKDSSSTTSQQTNRKQKVQNRGSQTTSQGQSAWQTETSGASTGTSGGNTGGSNSASSTSDGTTGGANAGSGGGGTAQGGTTASGATGRLGQQSGRSRGSGGASMAKTPVKKGGTAAVAGAATVNLSDLQTKAEIDGARISGAQTVEVDAWRDANLISAAGGGALARGGSGGGGFKAGIAGAVAVNIDLGKTEAFLKGDGTDTTRVDADSVSVTAVSAGTASSVGLGVALTQSAQGKGASASVAGSGSFSEINTTTKAKVGNIKLAAPAKAPGALDVTASDRSQIGTGGGALYVGGRAGLGVAITYATIDSDVKATLADTSGGNAFDAVRVDAARQTRIIAAAAAGGGSSQGQANLSGSFALNSVTATTVARITRSTLDADNGVAVRAGVAAKTQDVDKTRIDSDQGRQTIDYDLERGDERAGTGFATNGDDGTSGGPVSEDDGDRDVGTGERDTDYQDLVTSRGSDLAGVVGDGTAIIGVAGSVQLAGQKSKASVGLAAMVGAIDTTTKAQIDASQITADGDTTVAATAGANIIGAAVGAGVTTGKFAGMGSLTVNRVETDVIAEVTDSGAEADPATEIDTQSLSVESRDDSDLYGVSGNLAYSKQVAVGAAVGYNALINTTRARIADASVTATNGVTVDAARRGSIWSMAASGAFSSDKVGLAGSLAVNRIDGLAEAAVVSADIEADQLDVVADARDGANVYTLAGAVAGSGKAAIGASFALTYVGVGLRDNHDGPNAGAQARISDSDIAVADTSAPSDSKKSHDVRVKAKASSEIWSLAAAGGFSEKVAAGVASSSNTLDQTISAKITGTGTNIAGRSDGENTGTVTVKARDASAIRALGGALQGGDKGAAGGGVATNLLGGTNRIVSAKIADATVRASDAVEVDAKSDAVIETIAAAGAAADKAALQGSVTFNQLLTRTQARVDGAEIAPAEDSQGEGYTLTVEARDTSDVRALAGAVGGASKASLGAALSINDIAGAIKADISGGSSIEGAGTVTVKAKSSDARIQSIAAAAGAANNAAIGASVSLNTMLRQVQASVDGGASVETAQVADDGSPAVEIAAEERSTIQSLTGTVQAADKAAVSAAIGVNLIGKSINLTETVDTYLSGDGDDGGTDKSIAGDLTRNGSLETWNIGSFADQEQRVRARLKSSSLEIANTRGAEVRATREGDIETLVGGVGVANKAAVGVTAGYNEIAGTTQAIVRDGSVGDGDDGSAGAVTVKAMANDDIQSAALVGQLAAEAGVGAAVGVNRITGTTEAKITGGTGENNPRETVRGDRVRVEAESTATIQAIAAGLGAGGKVGLAGSVAGNIMQNTVASRIKGGVNIQADDSLGVTANSVDTIEVVAGALGLSGLYFGGAGAAAVNVIDSRTIAHVGNGASLTADGGGPGIEITTGRSRDAFDTDLESLNERETRDDEGGGNDPLRFDALNLEVPDAQYSETTAEPRGIVVNATARQQTAVLGATIATAFNPKGSAALAGTGTLSVIGGETKAVVEDANVTASSGDVQVTARNEARHNAYIAGAALSANVALSGTADVGVVDRSTTAQLLGGSATAEDGRLTVSAQTDTDVTTYALSAGAALVGVSGAALVPVIDTSTTAEIANPTDEEDAPGADVAAKAVKVDATTKNEFDLNAAGATAGAVAAGMALTFALSESTTTAEIAGSAEVTDNGALGGNVDGGVTVTAFTTNRFDTTAAGTSAGGFGLAGTASLIAVKGSTTAAVDNADVGVDEDGDSDPVDGGVKVEAAETLDVTSDPGAGVFGGSGAAGSIAALAAQSEIKAKITGGTVNTDGALDVVAARQTDVDLTPRALGATSGLGIAGTAGLILIGDGPDGRAAAQLDFSAEGDKSRYDDGGENEDGNGESIVDTLEGIANPGDSSGSRTAATGSTIGQSTGQTRSGETLDTRTSRDVGDTVMSPDAHKTVAEITGQSEIDAASLTLDSRARADLNVLPEATGVGVGTAGLGASLAYVRAASDLDAKIGAGAEVTTGGDIVLKARVQNPQPEEDQSTAGPSVKAQTTAAGLGNLGLAGAFSNVGIDNDVTARLAGDLEGSPTSVSVTASDPSDAQVMTLGEAGAITAGVGASIADAHKASQAEALIADDLSVDTDAVVVTADATGDLTVNSEAAAGGIGVAATGSVARARGASGAIARLGAAPGTADAEGTNVTADSVTVRADVAPEITATSRGRSFAGGVAIGVSQADARSLGTAKAQVGPESDLDGATRLRVLATLSDAADTPLNEIDGAAAQPVTADAQASAGGLLAGGTGASATATSDIRVDAGVGAGAELSGFTNGIDVRALGTTAEDARARAASGGLVSGGAADATARSAGRTAAWLGPGVDIPNGDGGGFDPTVGALSVKATSKADMTSRAQAGTGGAVSGNSATTRSKDRRTAQAGLGVRPTAQTDGDEKTDDFEEWDAKLEDEGAGRLYVPGLTFKANHSGTLDVRGDSSLVAAAGAGGVDASAVGNTHVLAGIDDATHVYSSGDIKVRARTSVDRQGGPVDGAARVRGTTAGGLTGADMASRTDVDVVNRVRIGEDTRLETVGDFMNRFMIDAPSPPEITVEAAVDALDVTAAPALDATGVAAALRQTVTTDAKVKNDARIADQAALVSVGDLGVGAYSRANVTNNAAAKASGAASGMVVAASGLLDVDQEVELENGARLLGMDLVSIGAGEKPDLTRDDALSVAVTPNADNNTAVPITDFTVLASLARDNTIDLAEGAAIHGAQDVRVNAAAGEATATARGTETNPYTDAFSTAKTTGTSDRQTTRRLELGANALIEAGAFDRESISITDGNVDRQSVDLYDTFSDFNSQGVKVQPGQDVDFLAQVKDEIAKIEPGEGESEEDLPGDTRARLTLLETLRDALEKRDSGDKAVQVAVDPDKPDTARPLFVSNGDVVIGAEPSSIEAEADATLRANGNAEIAVDNTSGQDLAIKGVLVPATYGGNIRFLDGSRSELSNASALTLADAPDGRPAVRLRSTAESGPALFTTGPIDAPRARFEVYNASGDVAFFQGIKAGRIRVEAPNGVVVADQGNATFDFGGRPWAQWEDYTLRGPSAYLFDGVEDREARAERVVAIAANLILDPDNEYTEGEDADFTDFVINQYPENNFGDTKKIENRLGGSGGDSGELWKYDGEPRPNAYYVDENTVVLVDDLVDFESDPEGADLSGKTQIAIDESDASSERFYVENLKALDTGTIEKAFDKADTPETGETGISAGESIAIVAEVININAPVESGTSKSVTANIGDKVADEIDQALRDARARSDSSEISVQENLTISLEETVPRDDVPNTLRYFFDLFGDGDRVATRQRKIEATYVYEGPRAAGNRDDAQVDQLRLKPIETGSAGTVFLRGRIASSNPAGKIEIGTGVGDVTVDSSVDVPVVLEGVDVNSRKVPQVRIEDTSPSRAVRNGDALKTIYRVTPDGGIRKITNVKNPDPDGATPWFAVDENIKDQATSVFEPADGLRFKWSDTTSVSRKEYEFGYFGGSSFKKDWTFGDQGKWQNKRNIQLVRDEDGGDPAFRRRLEARLDGDDASEFASDREGVDVYGWYDTGDYGFPSYVIDVKEAAKGLEDSTIKDRIDANYDDEDVTTDTVIDDRSARALVDIFGRSKIVDGAGDGSAEDNQVARYSKRLVVDSAELTADYSVDADQPVEIEVSGGTSGKVIVNTEGTGEDIRLAGQIRNIDGSTDLSAGGSIVRAEEVSETGAAIETETLRLDAARKIGAPDAPVEMALDGSDPGLDLEAGDSAFVASARDDLPLVRAKAGGDRLALDVIGDLRVTRPGTAEDPHLEASDGGIRVISQQGGIAGEVPLEVYSGDPVRGVYIESRDGDIDVRQSRGDFYVAGLSAAFGDVSATATSGDLRATRFEPAQNGDAPLDRRNSLLPLQGEAAEAAADRLVEAREEQVEQTYLDLWSLDQLAFDADGSVDLDPSAFRALAARKGVDPDTASRSEIAQFARQRRSGLLNDLNARREAVPENSASADALDRAIGSVTEPDGTFVSDLQYPLRASLRRRIKEDATWTEGQVRNIVSRAALDADVAESARVSAEPVIRGEDITLRAPDGAIGAKLPEQEITLTAGGDPLDPDEAAALRAAGPGDIAYSIDASASPTRYTFTVARRQLVNTATTASTTATAAGDVRLGAVDAVSAASIKSTTGSVRVEVLDGIQDASPADAPAITAGEDMRLRTVNKGLGAPDARLPVNVGEDLVFALSGRGDVRLALTTDKGSGLGVGVAQAADKLDLRMSDGDLLPLTGDPAGNLLAENLSAPDIDLSASEGRIGGTPGGSDSALSPDGALTVDSPERGRVSAQAADSVNLRAPAGDLPVETVDAGGAARLAAQNLDDRAGAGPARDVAVGDRVDVEGDLTVLAARDVRLSPEADIGSGGSASVTTIAGDVEVGRHASLRADETIGIVVPGANRFSMAQESRVDADRSLAVTVGTGGDDVDTPSGAIAMAQGAALSSGGDIDLAAGERVELATVQTQASPDQAPENPDALDIQITSQGPIVGAGADQAPHVVADQPNSGARLNARRAIQGAGDDTAPLVTKTNRLDVRSAGSSVTLKTRGPTDAFGIEAHDGVALNARDQLDADAVTSTEASVGIRGVGPVRIADLKAEDHVTADVDNTIGAARVRSHSSAVSVTSEAGDVLLGRVESAGAQDYDAQNGSIGGVPGDRGPYASVDGLPDAHWDDWDGRHLSGYGLARARTLAADDGSVDLTAADTITVRQVRAGGDLAVSAGGDIAIGEAGSARAVTLRSATGDVLAERVLSGFDVGVSADPPWQADALDVRTFFRQMRDPAAGIDIDAGRDVAVSNAVSFDDVDVQAGTAAGKTGEALLGTVRALGPIDFEADGDFTTGTLATRGSLDVRAGEDFVGGRLLTGIIPMTEGTRAVARADGVDSGLRVTAGDNATVWFSHSADATRLDAGGTVQVGSAFADTTLEIKADSDAVIARAFAGIDRPGRTPVFGDAARSRNGLGLLTAEITGNATLGVLHAAQAVEADVGGALDANRLVGGNRIDVDTDREMVADTLLTGIDPVDLGRVRLDYEALPDGQAPAPEFPDPDDADYLPVSALNTLSDTSGFGNADILPIELAEDVSRATVSDNSRTELSSGGDIRVDQSFSARTFRYDSGGFVRLGRVVSGSFIELGKSPGGRDIGAANAVRGPLLLGTGGQLLTESLAPTHTPPRFDAPGMRPVADLEFGRDVPVVITRDPDTGALFTLINGFEDGELFQ